MRKGLLLGSLAGFLIGGGTCIAQPTANLLPPVQPSDPPITAAPSAPPGLFTPSNAPFDYRTWGGVEYLLWRFSGSPLPTPLVSSGGYMPPAPPPPPVNNNGGDPVLFGGNGYSAGWQSGFRVTFGGWIDNDRLLGLEASGFYFVPRTPTNFAMGTNNPNQILAIPFNNVTPGGGTGGVSPGVIGANPAGQSAFLISGGKATGTGDPLIGSISASSYTSLWGAELNGVMNLYRNDRIQVNLLGGFRYADLTEDLYINTQTSDPAFGPLVPATFADHFGTRNQFYGGQLGLRGEWSNGIVFVNATGKCALGVNHETLSIDGSFSDPVPIFLNNYGAGPGRPICPAK